jgi:hypothetical protein
LAVHRLSSNIEERALSIASKSFPYGAHTVTIETGELARQA